MKKLLFLILVGLFFLPWGNSKEVPITPIAPVTPILAPGDPWIEQLAVEVGIPLEKLRTAKPKIDTVGCHEGHDACYRGEITIKPKVQGFNRYQQRVVIAHEYLHHVWSVEKLYLNEPLKAELNAFYLRHKPTFDYRMGFYIEQKISPNEWINEVHSFTCTEVADWKLTPYLLNHCTSLIPNRHALPASL